MYPFHRTGSVRLIEELLLNVFVIEFETGFWRIYDFLYGQILKTPRKYESSGDWQVCWSGCCFPLVKHIKDWRKICFESFHTSGLGALMDFNQKFNPNQNFSDESIPLSFKWAYIHITLSYMHIKNFTSVVRCFLFVELWIELQ